MYEMDAFFYDPNQEYEFMIRSACNLDADIYAVTENYVYFMHRGFDIRILEIIEL